MSKTQISLPKKTERDKYSFSQRQNAKLEAQNNTIQKQNKQINELRASNEKLVQKVVHFQYRERLYITQKFKLETIIQQHQQRIRESTRMVEGKGFDLINFNINQIQTLYQELLKVLDDFHNRMQDAMRDNEREVMANVTRRLDIASREMELRPRNSEKTLSGGKSSESDDIIERTNRKLEQENKELKQRVDLLESENATLNKALFRAKQNMLNSTIKNPASNPVTARNDPLISPRPPLTYSRIQTATTNQNYRSERVINRYKSMLDKEKKSYRKLMNDYSKERMARTEVFDLVKHCLSDVKGKIQAADKLDMGDVLVEALKSDENILQALYKQMQAPKRFEDYD